MLATYNKFTLWQDCVNSLRDVTAVYEVMVRIPVFAITSFQRQQKRVQHTVADFELCY